MSKIIKLLFDECVGSHVAAELQKFLRGIYNEPHEVRHFFEFQKAGTHDEVWIPEMAEKKFIAITGDRGKSNKGRKLPLLCVKYKMTHILLGPSVHSLASAEKIQAINSLQGKILLAQEVEPGSRFMISMAGTQSHATMRQIEISQEEIEKAAKYNEPTGPEFRLES